MQSRLAARGEARKKSPLQLASEEKVQRNLDAAYVDKLGGMVTYVGCPVWNSGDLSAVMQLHHPWDEESRKALRWTEEQRVHSCAEALP